MAVMTLMMIRLTISITKDALLKSTISQWSASIKAQYRTCVHL
jgi:hypothetical protein